MKTCIALSLLFVCVYSAPTFNSLLDEPWALFKRTFERRYSTVEEEINRYVQYLDIRMQIISYLFSSRSIWEANLAMIRNHNLEADIGVHTYTLKMNKFGDMVCKNPSVISRNLLKYFIQTNEEINRQMNGLDMSLKNKMDVDRHTFRAPANVAIPAAVGKNE